MSPTAPTAGSASTTRCSTPAAKWSSAFPDGPSGFDGPYYIRMIGSGDTMFGAWLPTDSTEIAFDVPDKVTSINVLLGGLGRGHEDGALDLNGIVCTAFISYAIPALLLMLSSGSAAKNGGWISSGTRKTSRRWSRSDWSPPPSA